MRTRAATLARLFKALSDENRLRILLSIQRKEYRCESEQQECRNETCIKELARSLKITVPTVSHHVKELINAELITARKEGRWVYCRIERRTFDRVCSFLDGFTGNTGRKR
jgi:DNA-binding transcriptional ArsR family regulator